MPSMRFPPDAFKRWDDTPDGAFYAMPRLVTHIDDGAIAAVTEAYRQLFPAGGVILDLMSSWVSHLPADIAFAEVVGLGMNAEELAANPRLTQGLVHDLNRDPRLPFEDRRFDAALCCVSVQYLQRPLEVFSEVRRVLRPGSPFAVTFSNRCFPTKAVAIWRALDLAGHAHLVRLYCERAGFTGIAARILADGMHGDPLIVVQGLA